MNIDELCDAVKRKHNLKSDRKLSLALGLSASVVNMWRTKRSWPSDETIIQLAEMAGEDPLDALINLNVWRSNGKATALYTRIRNAMAGTAAALLLAFIVLGATPDAQAAKHGSLVHSNAGILYIMENKWLWFLNRILRVVVLNMRVSLGFPLQRTCTAC